MSRITPINYRKLIKVFEFWGFYCDRQEGDHLIYIKKGTKRPVVIPAYSDVAVFIIKNNLKSSGISREEYLRILKRVLRLRLGLIIIFRRTLRKVAVARFAGNNLGPRLLLVATLDFLLGRHH